MNNGFYILITFRYVGSRIGHCEYILSVLLELYITWDSRLCQKKNFVKKYLCLVYKSCGHRKEKIW